MAGTFTKRVQFPIGGLNRSLAAQSQPPYTTCDCLNVWPLDHKTGRKRGARRPPLVSVGPGGYASGLSEVRVAVGATYNRLAMAMIAGSLYKSSTGASWTSVGSGFTANAPVGLIPYGNKLYIAAASGYKYYDFSDNMVHDWTADSPGTIPEGCTNGCAFLDRIVLVKDEQWFMSESGNPNGWDFGIFQAGAAIQGTDFLGGKIGAAITAPIPYGDDTLLFACQDQIYILRGDPTENASLGVHVQEFGPISRGGYCFGPNNEMAFLSLDGVYLLSGGAVQPISKKPLPKELLGLNSAQYDAAMAFDPRFNALHVVATHKTDTAKDQQWFMDWDTRGFYPERFSSAFRPTCAYQFGPLETDSFSPVLFAGVNIGRFQTSEDGEFLDNFVDIGPVSLGNGVSTAGLLQQLVIKFGENTDDDVQASTIRVVTAGDADSCKAALDAGDEDRLWTTTVRALRDNHWRCHPRLRGAVAMVEIEIPYSSYWSLEELDFIIQPLGTERYL